MKRINVLAVVLMSLILVFCTSAQAFSLPDQKYVFADPAVEKAVRSELGRYGGTIYRSDLDNVRSLSFEYTTVENVSDILCCRYVRELNFAHTMVEDFDRLSTMYGLECISLTRCPIDTEDFSWGFWDLKYLSLENCGICDIGGLGMLTNLRELDISGNGIADIDGLSNLTNLERLDISYNPIADLSVLGYMDNLAEVDAEGTYYCGAAYEGEADSPVWGLAVKNISTRTGPSTKYDEGGTYQLKGQQVKVLQRAWDDYNGIWWVQVEIPYNGGTRLLWTGYHRFDSSTIPLESIPIAK